MTLDEQQAVAAAVFAAGSSTSTIRQVAVVKGFNAGVEWERNRVEHTISVHTKIDPIGYFRATILRAGLSPEQMKFLSDWLASYTTDKTQEL